MDIDPSQWTVATDRFGWPALDVPREGKQSVRIAFYGNEEAIALRDYVLAACQDHVPLVEMVRRLAGRVEALAFTIGSSRDTDLLAEAQRLIRAAEGKPDPEPQSGIF